MSELGWVDFSSEDRELVRKVLAMVREPGTLDELGIGQIRDGFSDLLFPGISTIQTRAKYFVTVPQILRDYYDSRVISKKRKHVSLESYLKSEENYVAEILTNLHGKDEKGIIGSTQIASGGVARRPSSVYWNGLRQFGIVNVKSSLAEFARDYGKSTFIEEEASNEYGHDDLSQLRATQPVHLPKGINRNWKNELEISLTKPEAKFLVNKIRNAKSIEHSVVAQLYLNDLVDDTLQLNAAVRSSFMQLQTFMHEQDKVSDLCKKRMKTAEEFSFAMEGPHLRYNILLARKNNFENKVDEYEADFESWKKIADKVFDSSSVDSWLDVSMTQKINPTTRVFLQNYISAINTKKGNKTLDELVTKQAIHNKKKRSLLHKRLTHDSWMGIRRPDYRWNAAQPILIDIQRGCNAKS
tara:strand:- start:5406 stop:6641 length:1236 start_codon:yes stop_codon:yes gene_type:complete